MNEYCYEMKIIHKQLIFSFYISVFLYLLGVASDISKTHLTSKSTDPFCHPHKSYSKNVRNRFRAKPYTNNSKPNSISTFSVDVLEKNSNKKANTRSLDIQGSLPGRISSHYDMERNNRHSSDLSSPTKKSKSNYLQVSGGCKKK